MAKLTDKQKKQMMLDRSDGETIRALAKKYKVSTTTVQKVVTNNNDVAQMVTEKKQKNILDVLDYMDSRVSAYKRFCDYVFDCRLNPEDNKDELAELPLEKLVTMYGILTDKMLKSKDLGIKKDMAEHDKEIDSKRYW